MAKLFSSQDVKLLLEQHSRRLNSLKAASSVSEQYLSQIKTTSDNLAMQEVSVLSSADIRNLRVENARLILYIKSILLPFCDTNSISNEKVYEHAAHTLLLWQSP